MFVAGLAWSYSSIYAGLTVVVCMNRQTENKSKLPKQAVMEAREDGKTYSYVQSFQGIRRFGEHPLLMLR